MYSKQLRKYCNISHLLFTNIFAPPNGSPNPDPINSVTNVEYVRYRAKPN